MKKILILGIILLIPNSVSALTKVPFTISDNDSKASDVNVDLLEGEYILPKFCSTGSGCIIKYDADLLKSIGKFNFGSGEEYFYIFAGKGATIFEEAGPNPATEADYKKYFNMIIIDPTECNETLVVQMGSGDEAREYKFIPASTISSKNDNNDEIITQKKEFDPMVLLYSGIIITILLVGYGLYRTSKKKR